jgi:hypothetical protein
MSFSQAFEEKILQGTGEQIAVPAVDAHIHVVNFLQETEGLDALLKAMDKANIEKSVICGLPVRKKWAVSEPERPHYYLSDDARCHWYAATDELVAYEYLRLTPPAQERFAPLLCGFNPTDLLAIDYVEYMFGKYPFWRGIGELLLRHDDLTALTAGEKARVNHPALFDVYAFCAERHLPVLIHHNSTSIMHTSHFEYLGEIDQVLHKFPQTRFIWAHCGYSRRITHKDYYQMVADMLRRHPRLYVDLSWIFYDEIVSRQPAVKQKWAGLAQEFADRIMIGSDLCGHFDLLGKTMARYNSFLQLLPDPVQERIARKNAEEMYFCCPEKFLM